MKTRLDGRDGVRLHFKVDDEVIQVFNVWLVVDRLGVEVINCLRHVHQQKVVIVEH